KYGVVDSTGKMLIPPVYDNLELSGNKFVIAIRNKKWGLLDTAGKTLIPFKYDIISLAGDAFAVSIGYPDGKWGVINASGNTVIPVGNTEIKQFGAGYFVEKDNSGAALFDSAGVQRTQYGGARPADYPVWELG